MKFDELKNIKVGTKLRVDDFEATVIGYIEYANYSDGYKPWTEYRLSSKKGECWLSIDRFYKEYSISWPANNVRGNIGPEWHKVDEGIQVVKGFGGEVDVDYNERATFIEFEDETEELTLSVETWEDGTEYSKGEYLDLEEIDILGYENPKHKSLKSNLKAMFIVVAIFWAIVGLCMWHENSLEKTKVAKYIEESDVFLYKTSITGNEKQKADVYEYYDSPNQYGESFVYLNYSNGQMETVSYAQDKTTTDEVAKNIIDGIEGEVEIVTQKDDVENEDIAILTKYEYCLIYHPEDDADKVYVQISSRKYNYTSDNAPYHSSVTTTTWYRSHYYSSAYGTDSHMYSRTPSAYSMYNGDTIHNLGNGYFDSYSSSVRQNSINSRNSSEGGLGGGK